MKKYLFVSGKTAKLFLISLKAIPETIIVCIPFVTSASYNNLVRGEICFETACQILHRGQS